MYLGFAVGDLHLPPREFWQMTMTELMAAYAHLLPKEEKQTGFKPFTEEEKQILENLERKFGNANN
jgi:hypothetical protein